ncbi:MAG: HAMP domain-containing sensor histidine kinase [Deltaproteobacteria bacterium]|nr:HAMP domain-containing sensor histidine kinase [Deltaproteobacteria bacterium]
MRFLLRNAVFVLFIAVIVAVIFLGRLSFGTAVSFGEWGERSIAESTLLIAREKVERVEEVINSTDRSYFHILDPSPDAAAVACERWQRVIRFSRLVEAAALVDERDEIELFLYRDPSPQRASALRNLFDREVIPLIDRYESMDQPKHLHGPVGSDVRLVTFLTTMFDGHEHTACLLYDNDEISKVLFDNLLGNVEPDRIVNVIDNENRLIYGRDLGTAGEFIVGVRFPSTLYRWRVQLAPRSAALFTSKAQTQRFSKAMFIPLALGIIVFGMVVLYLSIVRERRLSRLKSDFIANVSHELKTPLSLIRMFSELLMMGQAGDEAKTRRYHGIILRETERLTTLIDNVLDLSKIERGKAAYEFQIQSIADVVERGVEIYRYRLEKLGIRLEYTVDPDLPLLSIDDHAITLLVINLIDNAAKYGKGTDVIGVMLRNTRGGVTLEVYDHGPGIPAGQLRRVFERFYRVSSAETRTQRGSGIGLSLVRHITEAHGGSVAVTSEPGLETRFTVTIPVAPPEKRRASHPIAPKASSSAPGPS